jgi:hypothetical protein
MRFKTKSGNKARRVLEITTTIGCKMCCAYCAQPLLIREYKKRSNISSFSMEAFKECINKVTSDVEIRFGGLAEPWLNNQCTDMLLFAFDKGHKISVFTTLVGMTTSDIKRMERVNFELFLVHLPSENGYEKIDLNNTYFKTLEQLVKNKIPATYHFHGTGVHPLIKEYIKNKELTNYKIISRCGHVKMEGVSSLVKKTGKIYCTLDLKFNIILPNGDLVLCCMDYGLEYILGNILTMDYDSLFKTRVFNKIEEGLKDDSFEILCRFCEFADYDNLFTRIIKRHIPSFMERLLRVKNYRDLQPFLQEYSCAMGNQIRKSFH